MIFHSSFFRSPRNGRILIFLAGILRSFHSMQRRVVPAQVKELTAPAT